MLRFVVVLAVAACGSKGGGGGLSKDGVEDLRKQLKEAGNLKTDDAVKRATDKLGAPAKTDGKKTIWGPYKDGDDCRQFTVEDMGGMAAYGTEGTSCPK